MQWKIQRLRLCLMCFNLNRFVKAQQGVYHQALSELRSGEKRSHWIWFIFPQLDGLGRSPRSRQFGIKSLDEAEAYIQHPLLGPRLLECTSAVLSVEGLSAFDIMGSPDDLKLRSCATLFARTSHSALFTQLLEKYFEGKEDEATLRLLTLAADRTAVSKPAGGECLTEMLAPQKTLAIRFRCPPFELGTRVPLALRQVGEALAFASATAAGPGYTRYLEHDPAAGMFELEVGIPVHEGIGGREPLISSELPGGAAVLVWHEGPYQSIGQSFGRLYGQVAAAGLTSAGPAWESYVVGPPQEADATKWRTALYLPVRNATAG